MNRFRALWRVLTGRSLAYRLLFGLCPQTSITPLREETDMTKPHAICNLCGSPSLGGGEHKSCMDYEQSRADSEAFDEKQEEV